MPNKDDEFYKELKRKRDEEEATASAIYKKRMRDITTAEREDAAHRASISHTEQSGREVTRWEDAVAKADAALNSEVRAYDDWRAAMLGMLAMYGALHAALHQSTNSVSRLIAEKLWDTVVVDLMWDGAIKPGWNKVKPAFGVAEEDLVALQHNVSFSDDNKLVIKPLLRLDNDKPIVDKDPNSGQALPVSKLDKLFRDGVVDWLKENGYTAAQGKPGEFKDKDGNSLTKAIFNNDFVGDRSLQSFLKRYTDAAITPGPRM